jgi:zinc protease
MTFPLILSLVSALSLSAAPAKKPSGVFPYPMKVSTLKNGLTIVRIPFESPGLVAFYTVVRVGSRNEIETGHTGFAHFFEHMMFRGTKRFPEGARGSTLAKLGFNENAFTTDDSTIYLVNGPSASLETLIDLEADRFAHLEYAEGGFQTEAQSVAGEYQKNVSNPSLKIEETSLATPFTKHTYQHTTIGFLADITEMPKRYEYSKTFFQRWYTPDNCVVVLAGDFDDAKAMALFEKHYGPWTGKAAKIEVPVEPPQKAARAVTLTWPSATLPRVDLFWHTPAASPKTMEAATQTVLASYLVGPTSPLYRAMVLEQGLVERIEAMSDLHRDPNLFGVDARLKVEAHREPVTKATLAAVADVAAGKLDGKRLEDIKSNLRYALLMQLETPSQTAQTVAWNIGIFGTTDAIDTLYANIAKVSAKDLSDFAKKHLIDTNRTTLTFTVEPKGATP